MTKYDEWLKKYEYEKLHADEIRERKRLQKLEEEKREARFERIVHAIPYVAGLALLIFIIVKCSNPQPPKRQVNEESPRPNDWYIVDKPTHFVATSRQHCDIMKEIIYSGDHEAIVNMQFYLEHLKSGTKVYVEDTRLERGYVLLRREGELNYLYVLIGTTTYTEIADKE